MQKKFYSIFKFVLGPDLLWSAADSAVKIFGGWLTENLPKIGWRGGWLRGF
jgi:hypothetical protein